jgi:hypothetical protein
LASQSTISPLFWKLSTCFNQCVFRCAFFLVAAVAVSAPAADIYGTITNERGRPVGGATINAYRGGYAITTAKADSQGRFRLPTFPPVVVLIEQPDYEPFVNVISASEPVRLTLLDHPGRRWSVPACTSEEGNRPGWSPLRFAFPRDGSTRHSTDIDYERVAVAYGSPAEILEVWSGQSVSRGFPNTPGWFREKAKLAVRSIAFRDRIGIDFRANFNDGRTSRWVGAATNFAAYEAVSPKAAKLFDSVIDVPA